MLLKVNEYSFYTLTLSVRIHVLLIIKYYYNTKTTAFTCDQVRSPYPSCRGYAYRILGLIAMRCFDLLGEKIVGQLLLKKRFREIPENRLIITIILWNLLYIWPETLAHILIRIPSDYGMGETGLPINVSLIQDLWAEVSAEEPVSSEKFGTGRRDEIPSGTRIRAGTVPVPAITARLGGIPTVSRQSQILRSVCILSAGRVIAAKRISDINFNHFMVSMPFQFIVSKNDFFVSYFETS